MFDVFPIQIFTAKNALDLIHGNRTNEAIYISFFSFLTEGILNEKINLVLRSKCFEIAMVFSCFYYHYLLDSTEAGFSIYEKNNKGNIAICMFT